MVSLLVAWNSHYYTICDTLILVPVLVGGGGGGGGGGCQWLKQVRSRCRMAMCTCVHMLRSTHDVYAIAGDHVV